MSKKIPFALIVSIFASTLLINPVTANAASVPLECSVQTQPVFQVNNPTTGSSLLTRNASEVKLSASQGFTENKGTVFKASSRLVTGLVPVYRMVKGTDYIWVPKLATTGEFESAKKLGYVAKHVEFYASKNKLDCTVPVYRYLKNGQHKYTANNTELSSGLHRHLR
jgi:hypothetical protein